MEGSDSEELDEVYEDADEEMHEEVSNNQPTMDFGGSGDRGNIIDLT